MSKARPEDTLENKICEGLWKAGWSADHCESINQDGWPDITAFKGVFALLLEVKIKTVIRTSQRRFAREMWRLNGTIVWSVRFRDGIYHVQPVNEDVPSYLRIFRNFDDMLVYVMSLPSAFHGINPIRDLEAMDATSQPTK